MDWSQAESTGLELHKSFSSGKTTRQPQCPVLGPHHSSNACLSQLGSGIDLVRLQGPTDIVPHESFTRWKFSIPIESADQRPTGIVSGIKPFKTPLGKCIATSNKGIATRNHCITTSNKKLLDLKFTGLRFRAIQVQGSIAQTARTPTGSPCPSRPEVQRSYTRRTQVCQLT